MVGVGVGLDAAERAKGVFGIVVPLKKPKKLPKLGRRSGAPEGSGKVGSGILSVREGLYLKEGMVDTFKNKI